jgi:hypothetical protein
MRLSLAVLIAVFQAVESENIQYGMGKIIITGDIFKSQFNTLQYYY